MKMFKDESMKNHFEFPVTKKTKTNIYFKTRATLKLYPEVVSPHL
jgi:hypothetical protein